MNNTDLMIGILTIFCAIGWLLFGLLVAVIGGLAGKGEYDE